MLESRCAAVIAVGVIAALLVTAPGREVGVRPEREPAVPTGSRPAPDPDGGAAVVAVRTALAHMTGSDAHDAAGGTGVIELDARGAVVAGDAEHPVTIAAADGDSAWTHTDVLARRLGSAGAQLLTVIHDPDAPVIFTYDLGLPPDTDLLLRAGGSADVVDATGAVVGSFAAPWALAADGRRVPTRYYVHGSSLTQVVDHRAGIAYPVVADPAYQRNCGIVTCTWYLSVAKTREIAKQLGVLAVNVAINLNVGAACAVAGVAGGPVAGVLCTVITAVGVAHAQAVFSAAARSGDCVRLATGVRVPLGRVGLSNRYCSRK